MDDFSVMFNFRCKKVRKFKGYYTLDLYDWKTQLYSKKIGSFKIIATNLNKVRDIIYIYFSDNPHYNNDDKKRVESSIIMEAV